MAKRNRKRKGQRRDRGAQDSPGTPTTTQLEDEHEGASGNPSKRPTAQGFAWWRENLEAIIVAFILALIIRHFSVEAFEIPTGSMAPTLYGIHAWFDCPNCDTRFNCGIKTDRDSNTESKIPFTAAAVDVYLGNCPNNQCRKPHHRSSEAGKPLRPGSTRFTCEHCGTGWKPPANAYRREVVMQRTTRSRVPSDPTLVCPICQYTFTDILTPGNRSSGHKILVNKFAYRGWKPRRWDVIVFHFDEEKNYIKRLLGLPGEAVSLSGGDLYVEGPGEQPRRIQRKLDRPDAQESLWTKISDSDAIERGFNKDPAWIEVFEKGTGLDANLKSKWWSQDAKQGRLSVNVQDQTRRVAALRFNRNCQNTYNYNLISEQLPGSGTAAPEEVGDKKLAFTVRPSKGTGWIGGELRDGKFTYQFRIPVESSGEKQSVLRRLSFDDPSKPFPTRATPKEWADQEVRRELSLPLMKPSRIEFENVDDRVAVRLNGEEILSAEYESGSPAISKKEHYLLLLASDVSADFQSIQVYRDVYYRNDRTHGSQMRQSTDVVRIGSEESGQDNEYFPCGDNSPSSFDGRFWGTVPERNMMGKAFVIFWPALPWNWQCGFIN